jgi:EAL domain-containing protein (putative c-di-GMP-specific phosphodiesterase class I)
MPAMLDATFSDLISSRVELSVGSPSVDRILGAVRRHLGMDIAFVSQFRAADRVFRHVDSQVHSPINVGDAISLDEGYCKDVVEGRLPELIPDTARVPAAMAKPATQAIPIGSHLSVPIRLADGSCYGTFCCFSFRPNQSLGQRDLEIMRVFADILADQLNLDIQRSKSKSERLARVQSALANGHPKIVYQPIYNLDDGRIAGFECLSRFPLDPQRPPNEWFSEAHEVGLGGALEMAAIREALSALKNVRPPLYLTVNCSPGIIADGSLHEAIKTADLSRVIVEITEHVHIDDYSKLLEQLSTLRALGLRVAIDDAGAGYSSMRHILKIHPDIIKLDISLTKNIDADSTQRALAAALIAFARETGATIVAEGIETEAELRTLKRLGISAAQGYYLARPSPLADSMSLLKDSAVKPKDGTPPRIDVVRRPVRQASHD